MNYFSEIERSGIQDFVNNLAQPEQIRFCGYVHEGKVAKKVKDKRIAVVTDYQLLIFGREKSARKQPKRVHLLDLVQIGYENNLTVLKIRDPKSKAPVLLFIQSDAGLELPREIQSSYEQMTPNFPEELKMKVDIPNTILQPKGKRSEYSEGGGFFDVYKGFCAYYNVKVHVEFMHHVSRLISKGIVDLDLTECPGLDSKSDLSFSLTPIIMSLRHNTYFRAITICDSPRKEVVSLIGSILKNNRSITRITLKNVAGEERGFVDLGSMMKGNIAHAVQIVQLVDNNIGNRGAISLSESLALWPHALRVLDLSNSKIHEKGIVALFVGLEKCYGMSLSIEELNLSGNTFDKHGSMALNTWMTNVKSYSKLRKLYLSNCNLQIHLLIAMKSLSHLQEIDLSSNKIDDGQQCIQVANVCETSSTLVRISLSDCGLNKGAAESILESIIGNVKIRSIDINISNNNLGNDGVKYITSALSRSNNIIGLDVSGSKMKEKLFIEFIDEVIKNKSIEKLMMKKVLNKNHVTSDEKIHPIISSLTNLLQTSRFHTLSLSDGFGKPIILSVLKHLETDSKVEYLDISGNLLGDIGAHHIAEMLRKNQKLHHLVIDDNHITLSGYQSIRYSLEVNKNLYRLDYPKNDINQIMESYKDSPQKTIQFSHLMATITNMLHSHNMIKETVETPTTIQPHTDVPEYLLHSGTTLRFEDVPDIIQSGELERGRSKSTESWTTSTGGETSVTNLHDSYHLSAYESDKKEISPASSPSLSRHDSFVSDVPSSIPPPPPLTF